MTATMPAPAVAITIITMSGNTSSGLTVLDSAAGAARTLLATASDYVASFVIEIRPAASRVCAWRNTTMQLLLIARDSRPHATNRTRRCDRDARTFEPTSVFVSY
jgi:hypothetical protein